MHTLQAPAENADEPEAPETTTPVVDMEKLEAMVTPEQVLSASVARRRRKFSKKRSNSANRGREQTPVREINGDKTSTSETEDENLAPRPKTPERRRRKTTRTVSKIDGNVEKEKQSDCELKEKAQTLKPPEEKAVKRDNFADIAQTEFLALYNKAKRSVSRGRERFKKHDKLVAKRSQSTPNQLTEQELIESFKKAQLLDGQTRNLPKRASSFRKYSTDSSLRSTTPERLLPKPKPIKPEFKRCISQQRKPQRVTSRKIIEFIDPKSFNLVYKKPPEPKIPVIGLIRALSAFSLLEIIRSYRAYKREMKQEYNKIRRLRSRCISELIVLMIYCGLGSVVFKFIEGAFENFYKCGVKRVKRDFIELLWYKSHNLREEDWKSLARNKLRIFEEELHQAHEAGMRTYSGQRSWSFLNGVVYALTVITTIGYGHIYPTTTTGQALTIVYSIIGIPLFLIALTDFGKLFTRCIKFFWSFVRRLYYTGSCRRARKRAHVQEIFKGAQMMYEIATMRRPSQFNLDPEAINNNQNIGQNPDVGNDTPTTPAPSNFEIDDEFNLPISLAIFILVLYIFLGAVVYCFWEGWGFFSAFYFVFISMSTIGFGDFVPQDPICMMVSIVYLVFGLALMSMCINVVQAKLSDTFREASAKIGATIGLKVDEEDGTIGTVPPAAVEMPEVHDFSPKTDETEEPKPEEPTPVNAETSVPQS